MSSMSIWDSDAEDMEEQASDYSDQSDIGDYELAAQSAEPQAKQVDYRVYNVEQLRERQKEIIEQIVSILSISSEDALRVLRHCSWDTNRVNEEWFTDSDQMREKLGLAEPGSRPRAGNKRKQTCQICFEDYTTMDMFAAPCNHHFCSECWAGYVTNAINSGPTSLNLRCPLPDCQQAVPQCIIRRVSSGADEAKFLQYALRSYVEDNKRLSWCPAPGCEHAVECVKDIGSEPLDVQCRCGSAFCFTCHEEAHRPVDCETVTKWIQKNSAESENANWILANTKPCPKCKRPIEKNQGCMHMVCTQCRSEFCWLCLGNWAEHGERTGGYYSCNRWETARKKGDYDEETQKRENAKQALERYMHYFQRWAENDKARAAATKMMVSVSQGQLEKLSELTATPTSQLKFVLDAWAQVMDCRRILKWTYAYGYYSFENENNKARQDFFEYTQEQAESRLEALHDAVEKQPEAFLESSRGLGEWPKFRESLIGLTDVVRSYFEKLVLELEKGLDSLEDTYRGEVAAASADAGEAEAVDYSEAAAPAGKKSWREALYKGGKKGRPPAKSTRSSHGSSQAQSSEPTAMATAEAGDVDEGEAQSEAEALAGYWQCHACTSANKDMDGTRCEVCETPRRTRAA